MNEITRILILALGVCYHASLLKREEYREHISPRFQQPLTLPHGADTIADEIDRLVFSFDMFSYIIFV